MTLLNGLGGSGSEENRTNRQTGRRSFRGARIDVWKDVARGNQRKPMVETEKKNNVSPVVFLSHKEGSNPTGQEGKRKRQR